MSVRLGELVLVRFGSSGTQIAKVLDLPPGNCAWVKKWRDRSGTWTAERWLPLSHIVGLPAVDDPRRIRAARSLVTRPAAVTLSRAKSCQVHP